jgi:Fe-S-cluster-containing hydrogenase component 2
VCAFEAITVDSSLAYIDSEKCKLCRKCVNECPTGAIHIINMEPLKKEPKPAPNAAAESKVETAKNE